MPKTPEETRSMIECLIYGFRTDMQEALGLGICADCDTPFFSDHPEDEFLCEECFSNVTERSKQ